MRRALLALASLCAMLPAAADEAAVRRMIEAKLRNGAHLQSVRKAPWGNLYEIVVRAPDGIVIYYADEQATVLIAGQVVDAKSGLNYTEERQRELSRIGWSTLPLQWAITSVRGSGRRKIAILSDPNCPYCKRFEEDLAKLDDITVHILPYATLSPSSVRQAKAVWCAKDRVQAWNDLMFRRKEPQVTRQCDTPIEKLIEYGRRLNVSATPTWFVESGERYAGAMPPEDVMRVLDKASPLRR